MIIIETGDAKTKRLLGKQEPQNTKYRMIRYVLRAECEDGILLYHVITGQMILLQKTEASILDKLPSCRNEEMDALIADFYLVPIGYDEKTTVHQLRKLLKRLFPVKGINSYLILTTTNCNARCAYCFENGIRRIDMDEAMAERVAVYIAKHKSKEEAELHWFGGEPLLCVDRIDQICRALAERRIGYQSVMTSNGYLFSDDIIRRATQNWKLRKVQITLDGTESVYNQIKGYVAANGSPYRRVLENVGKLLEAGIQVALRMNMDEESGEDLGKLTEELNERFSETKCLNVYVSKIQRERTREAEMKLDRKVMEMNDCLEQMGLGKRKLQLPCLRIYSCMADSDESVVIFPDGRLGKCEDVHDEDAFGRIDSERVSEELEAFREIFEYEYCERCPVYPTCILLRKCPTKQHEQYETCQMSISKCKEDILLWYETHRGETKNAKDA